MKTIDLLKSFAFRQVYPGIFIYIYINPKGKQYVCCTDDRYIYEFLHVVRDSSFIPTTRQVNKIRKFIVSRSTTSLKDFIELFDKLEK